MEEEAREILRSALTAASHPNINLAQAIRRRFARVGGVDLDTPGRDAVRSPPEFSE